MESSNKSFGRDKKLLGEAINEKEDINLLIGKLKEEKEIDIPAIPSLIAALKDDEVRTYATAALIQIGTPAIPSLIAALGNEETKVFAQLALEEIGTPEALEAVRKSPAKEFILDEENEFSKQPQSPPKPKNRVLSVIFGLMLFGIGCAFFIFSLENRWLLVPGVLILGFGIWQLFFNPRQRTPDTPVSEASALVSDKVTTPTLAKEIEVLIEKLKDKETRASAMLALGKIGLPAIPSLEIALKDEETQVYATMLLVAIGIPAVPSLIAALKDEETQANVSSILRKIDVPITPSLIAALKDGNLQTHAVLALTLGLMSSKMERTYGIKIEFAELEEDTIWIRVSEVETGLKDVDPSWDTLDSDKRQIALGLGTAAAIEDILQKQGMIEGKYVKVVNQPQATEVGMFEMFCANELAEKLQQVL